MAHLIQYNTLQKKKKKKSQKYKPYKRKIYIFTNINCIIFVSVTFTGVETLVSLNSVNVENTFYLLWYACPWWTDLPKIKLRINLGQMFISDWKSHNLLEEWCLYWFWIKKSTWSSVSLYALDVWPGQTFVSDPVGIRRYIQVSF